MAVTGASASGRYETMTASDPKRPSARRLLSSWSNVREDMVGRQSVQRLGFRRQRRRLLFGAASFAVLQAASLPLSAQPVAKIPVIGMLDGGKRLWWWKAFL